jgi:hypothetical protein
MDRPAFTQLYMLFLQIGIDAMQSKQESSDDSRREFAEKLQQHQTLVAAAQQTLEEVQARCAETQAAQEAILVQKQSKEEELRAAQSRCFLVYSHVSDHVIITTLVYLPLYRKRLHDTLQCCHILLASNSCGEVVAQRRSHIAAIECGNICLIQTWCGAGPLTRRYAAAAVVRCRVLSEQQLMANLQRDQQQLRAANGQKLALLGGTRS